MVIEFVATQEIALATSAIVLKVTVEKNAHVMIKLVRVITEVYVEASITLNYFKNWATEKIRITVNRRKHWIDCDDYVKQRLLFILIFSKFLKHGTIIDCNISVSCIRKITMYFVRVLNIMHPFSVHYVYRYTCLNGNQIFFKNCN